MRNYRIRVFVSFRYRYAYPYPCCIRGNDKARWLGYSFSWISLDVILGRFWRLSSLFYSLIREILFFLEVSISNINVFIVRTVIINEWMKICIFLWNELEIVMRSTRTWPSWNGQCEKVWWQISSWFFAMSLSMSHAIVCSCGSPWEMVCDIFSFGASFNNLKNFFACSFDS
jgi:hypothetical protein